MSDQEYSRREGEDWVGAFEQNVSRMRRVGRMHLALFFLLFILAVAGSMHVAEVSIVTLIEGLPGLANYVSDITPQIRADHVIEDVGEWYWNLDQWLLLLVDTLFIAFAGTLLGTAFAFLLCFPASRNLTPHPAIYFVSRRVLEFARSVPELVFAMIFVFSFGIGPFPGVLAIALHTAGALGKLFSEVNENADLGPAEGVTAVGGTWVQTMRFGIVPQVMPNFVSYTLLRFEINVRAASVIGFVGAGGIGQELMFVIRQFIYQDISALVLMIIITVAAIDILCEKFRHSIIGKEALL